MEPMEDEKQAVKELTRRVCGLHTRGVLEHMAAQFKQMSAGRRRVIAELEQEIALFKRKNAQIETEIERELLDQDRNASQFSKSNAEKLKIAKKLISLEQTNANLESAIADIERDTISTEAELKKYGSAAAEMLYYELVKGFQVDFVKKEGKELCRIANLSKKDVFYVDLEGVPVEEVSNAIWNALEE